MAIKERLFKRSIINIILLISCVLAIYPILRVVTIALRPGDRAFTSSLKIIPEDATMDAFKIVLFERGYKGGKAREEYSELKQEAIVQLYKEIKEGKRTEEELNLKINDYTLRNNEFNNKIKNLKNDNMKLKNDIDNLDIKKELSKRNLKISKIANEGNNEKINSKLIKYRKILEDSLVLKKSHGAKFEMFSNEKLNFSKENFYKTSKFEKKEDLIKEEENTKKEEMEFKIETKEYKTETIILEDKIKKLKKDIKIESKELKYYTGKSEYYTTLINDHEDALILLEQNNKSLLSDAKLQLKKLSEELKYSYKKVKINNKDIKKLLKDYFLDIEKLYIWESALKLYKDDSSFKNKSTSKYNTYDEVMEKMVKLVKIQENTVYKFFNASFWIWFKNSMIVSIFTVVFGVTFASTAGYAFSRFSFPGKSFGLTFFLITQMFPPTMLLLPMYLVMSKLQLTNTYFGLVLMYTTTALPLCVWQMKGYYDTIPYSLEEAGKIDGCSDFQAFYRLVLPLVKPGIVVTALFSFMASWTDFVVANVMMQREELKTLPLGLQSMNGRFWVEWANFSAASILVMIPALLLFIYLSKFLVSGLTLGGVKE